MIALQHVCSAGVLGLFLPKNLTMEEYPTNQIPIFLSVLAPQIIDIMELCMLRGFEVPCDELFTNVLTDRGLCFTFNMLNGDKLYKKT